MACPCRKDVVMSGRRRFSAEFKVEAAHRVIDSGRPISEVAGELTIGGVCPGLGVNQTLSRPALITDDAHTNRIRNNQHHMAATDMRMFPNRGPMKQTNCEGSYQIDHATRPASTIRGNFRCSLRGLISMDKESKCKTLRQIATCGPTGTKLKAWQQGDQLFFTAGLKTGHIRQFGTPPFHQSSLSIEILPIVILSTEICLLCQLKTSLTQEISFS